jgi:hypothetical protein
MATDQEIRDAANNQVAVASVAYAMDPSEQERIALRTVLACAQGHGLTVAELRDASGLDEPFITRLLEEATPT